MIDRYNRNINYLRLSVTERCNLRCRYCMPEDGICKKKHADMLTEDEMIQAIEAAASLGITKLRITGGEPLIKKNIISMCHPVLMDGINLELRLDETRLSVEITATVSCDGRTGVEMEALTAVSTAALTVYDMCKAVQKDMTITDIHLISKTDGVHGDYWGEETR